MTDFILGIVSDTHVPDRVKNLHPNLLSGLRKYGVQRILHAGDICSHCVIDELESVAPVTAVQGNRDFFFDGKHPNEELFEINGVQIGLAHGYGNWIRYFTEKMIMMWHGYRLDDYYHFLIRLFPRADVLVFGHTHRIVNERRDGRLLINPGSTGTGGLNGPPAFAVLRISAAGETQSEIVRLKGARLRAGKWVGETG